jgi:hypothetical protein
MQQTIIQAAKSCNNVIKKQSRLPEEQIIQVFPVNISVFGIKYSF